MKTFPRWTTLVPVTAFALAACKKTEEVEKAVEEAASSVADAVEAVVPDVPAMSAEERAAKLGIAGHLSADTECVLALYDGKGMVQGLSELDTWKFFRDIIEEEEGVNPEDVIAEEGEMVGTLLGEEIFMAFGAGMGPQLEGLMEVNARMGYHQMRLLSHAAAQGMAEGDFDEATAALDNEEAYLMELVKDAGRLMPVIEKAEVPPVLVGIKVSDEEARGQSLQEIRSFFDMLASEGEAVTIDKGGADLSGYLFKGEMLAEEMEGGRDEIEGTIGAANADRLIAAMREKNLVVAAGTLGEYLMFYVGGSTEACPLVDDVKDSLAASDAVSFVDAYADKPVYGFVFYDESLMAAGNRGTFGPMAEGIRDGIQGVEGFGDTRELVALLDVVAEREEAMVSLYKPADLGGLITVDQGARFELFGGGDRGAVDYGTTHSLSSLGEGEDVLLFANWIPSEEYTQRSSEMVDAVVETAYAFARKVSEMEVDDLDFEQFKGGFQMFDEVFRKDLVAAWDGLKVAEEGLGAERAVVVDLSGDFPPIPNVPQEIVEGGRFVRASYVAPVTDRAKLKESWATVNESIRALLKSAKDAGLGSLNMPDPTSSEKDGTATWYFDMLAFSDDVKPSVTVNDAWFAASTSRTQALDLVDAAATAEGSGRSGIWVELDLDTLRKYFEEALKLVDENGEVVFAGNDSDLADFREQLPRILKGLAALDEFDAVTFHDRMEGGRHRSSLHFRTR